MNSQPGYRIIIIHILPNISRSKDNQAIKFGQLIKYDMRNIILEKSGIKCGGEIFPKSFVKKLSISLDQQLKVLYSLVLLYSKLRTNKICCR